MCKQRRDQKVTAKLTSLSAWFIGSGEELFFFSLSCIQSIKLKIHITAALGFDRTFIREDSLDKDCLFMRCLWTRFLCDDLNRSLLFNKSSSKASFSIEYFFATVATLSSASFDVENGSVVSGPARMLSTSYRLGESFGLELHVNVVGYMLLGTRAVKKSCNAAHTIAMQGAS